MESGTRVNYGNGLYGENNTIDFDKYLSDEMLPYTSALLKSDFEFYIQFFYRAIYKDYFRTCWFHKEIIKSLEEFVYGNPEKKNLAISIPPRWGKLIADETPVLTKRGWITHAEIVVGDYVLSPSGKFVKVLAVGEKAPANCKVRFSDGDEIYCHENHEWVVSDRHLRKERTIETKELLVNKLYDGGEEKKRGHRYRFQLPFTKAIEGEEKKLAVEPYVLGAWLGDGTNTKEWITGDAKDIGIIEKIESLGYDYRQVYTHKTTGVKTYVLNGLKDDLKKFGMCKTHTTEKYIPDEYFTASIRQRLELLAGLIDTDGQLNRKEHRYHFFTSDKRLLLDVEKLIYTFGWRCCIVEREPRLSTSGIQGKKKCYSISFNPDMEIPCVLPRKQLKEFSKRRKIAFESVERGDFDKIGNCIQVEGGIYCVGNRLKPTHNSILMIMWISWCFGIDPTCNFIYTCYEERITNKMSDDILNIIRHPFYQKLFGVQMNSNTEAKALWETKEKGTYRASPMGGAMTGFGAGKIGSKFGGGFIIDDPLNAKFFNSEVEKKRVEENYQAVIKKRLNNPAKTPIVLIMQRLAVDDLVGYIEANEADDWKIIRVPALNEDVNPPKSNWEWKSPTEVLLKEKKQSPYIFAAQMQQSPVVLGGELVKEEWFKFYNPMDTVRYKKVFFTADTAFKTNEWNDYTAVGLWAITEKNDLRLIDLLHKKIEAVDLLKEFFAFKNRWSGGVRGLPANVFYIEDKASGMELIQRMRREGGVSVIPVKDKGFDKMTKWNNSLFPYLEAGNVLLPNDKNDPRSKEVIAEMVLLCGDGSHKHDDICDMMTQAGEIAFGKKGMF